MADRYVTKSAFVSTNDAGEWSVTADELVEPIGGKPKKTGLVDRHGRPIYRVRPRVPIGFRVGRARPG